MNVSVIIVFMFNIQYLYLLYAEKNDTPWHSNTKKEYAKVYYDKYLSVTKTVEMVQLFRVWLMEILLLFRSSHLLKCWIAMKKLY